MRNGSKKTKMIVYRNGAAIEQHRRPKFVHVLFLFLFLPSCILIFALLPSSSLPNSTHASDSLGDHIDSNGNGSSLCLDANISCDRSSIRTDVCVMKGCISTHSPSSSLVLHTSTSPSTINGSSSTEIQRENIKPYTRKWETSVMNTIEELHLTINTNNMNNNNCDVNHDVPAVFFSTGGYTGNVYHEFNDGLIPLYITSQHFNKQVVFVILEYHDWWISKYADVLSQLSNYSAVDFNGDNRTHCFPEAIVGLKIHDELAIDPLRSNNRSTIVDFHNLLDRAYWPRISFLAQIESHIFNNSKPRIPKLAIVSRKGSRAMTNEDSLVKLAERIGFQVEVLKPDRTTELAKIYRALNWSDVMIGVHGAAMTHLLFMRPGSVFIQVIPLGLEWASETYYGEPARKMGLKYIGYRILPRESSLYDKYDENDPVLRDPQSVSAKGWNYTKAIYLDAQNVALDIDRFEKRLLRAYRYVCGKIAKDRGD